MKYLPPESPLRRLIEINALDAETCEQIIREVEQYVVDRYETIEPRLRLSVTVTIPDAFDVEFTNEDFEECHE